MCPDCSDMICIFSSFDYCDILWPAGLTSHQSDEKQTNEQPDMQENDPRSGTSSQTKKHPYGAKSHQPKLKSLLPKPCSQTSSAGSSDNIYLYSKDI